ncbi:MAG: hypothetical protein UHS49_01085 [Faecalimonas sp.]|nr:hypothetical protein [Faecalimonas sp.]
MAAMDEFRKEREAIKQAPLKEKLAYFWEYYKWHTIITLFVIVALTSYIYTLATKKDNVLNGVLLNTLSMEADATGLIEGFSEAAKVDLDEYSINFNRSLTYSSKPEAASSNMSAMQAMMAWNSAGDIDFITADAETMIDLAYRGYFADLSEILDEEAFTKYEPYMLYMDEAVVEAQQEAYDNMEETTDIIIPDPAKPEEMKKPIPVLLDVSACEGLQKAYGYETETLSLGLTKTGKNQEMALKFVDYVMK